MTAKVYYTTMAAILGGILVSPEMDLFFKIMLAVSVGFVTTLVNLLFRIQQIRDLIVKHVTAAVINEIMKDADVRRVIGEKIFAGKKLSGDPEN